MDATQLSRTKKIAHITRRLTHILVVNVSDHMPSHCKLSLILDDNRILLHVCLNKSNITPSLSLISGKFSAKIFRVTLMKVSFLDAPDTGDKEITARRILFLEF